MPGFSETGPLKNLLLFYQINTAVFHNNFDTFAIFDFAADNLLTQNGFYRMNNQAFQRSCPKGDVKAGRSQIFNSFIGIGKFKLELIIQAFAQFVQNKFDDILDLTLFQSI